MTTVPMFPLNSVMFPGVVVPLHIFEERYRQMVRSLLEQEDPAERVFGVVAIREGYEVGEHGMQSAHRVGTLVQLTEVDPYDDGRFDIVVVGRQRLRMLGMETDGPFLTSEVELLDDPVASVDAAAADAATRTMATFESYRAELSRLRGGPVLAGDMPTDPTFLSYSLSATCLLTLAERQGLLEADDAESRLTRLRRTMLEEMRAMRAVPSLPATEVARTRWSPN